GALRGVAATALGVAGAAVQLLPTWQWTGETIRVSAALVPTAGGQWSLDLARLPELVSPGLFVGLPRSFRAPVFEAFGGTAESPFPWAPSVFVGAPVLLLALSPGRAGRRTAAVLLGLAALFLWIALGRQAGASQALGAVPVWGALRYWEKMVAPLALLLALAAAVGADAIGEEGAPRLPRRALVVGLLLLLAAGVALLVPVAPGGAAWLYRSRLAAGLAFSAASTLALAAVAGPRFALPGSAVARVALLVLVQSAAAAPFGLHGGSSAATEPRPPALPAAPPGPRVITPFPTNFATGTGDLDAIDRTLALQSRTGWPAANVASRVENAESYTGFGSIRAATVAGAGVLKWPLLRRLGATHVVSPEPAGARESAELRRALGNAPREVARGADGVWAWEVEHRERATFAPGVRAVPGLREAAQAMGPVLAGRSPDVVVEAPFAPPAGPGRVLSVSRTDASLKVEGECAAPCLLVVNEAWAPGWVAEIDGRPAPVLPADVLVRAVPWPAGRHAMVMRYEAPGLPLGLALSGAAAVVVAAGALLERRRRASRRVA
ncbi:MAG TPA: hypothetical protein VFM45_10040, partial [Anaeromyxobacteraceae bacterium]|nr:hypothetical protein [Anaeromyxobacteraceae bacterium]